jgi:hypothetical protein
MDEVKDSITLVFNKFYAEFLKDIKTINDDIRAKVKANYKVLNKNSGEYILFFQEDFTQEFVKALLSDDRDVYSKKFVAKDIDIHSLFVNEENTSLVMKYVYILTILNLVFVEIFEMPTPEEQKTFFSVVINGIVSSTKEGVDFDDVIDEDLRGLLVKLASINKISDAPSASKEKTEDPFSSLFGNIENSFIGSLAKEISNDINIDDLNIESPADIMKMMDFSSGQNNAVGNIVKKVTSKISEKINKGELDQDNLIKEVMNMMGTFGNLGKDSGGGSDNPLSSLMSMMNNPMMGDLMKNMSKGGGKGKVAFNTAAAKKQSARDRLREKFEKRQLMVEETVKTD